MKTIRDKKRTFHRLSPFITRTLTFIPCSTLFLITWSTKEKKNKRKKKEELNCTNDRKPILKTFLVSVCSYWVIYRPKGPPGTVYGPARQILMRDSIKEPQKRDRCGRTCGTAYHVFLVCPLSVCTAGFLITAPCFGRSAS